MKKFYSAIAALLLCYASMAQGVPQAVNYQAIARDAGGNSIPNQPVSIRLTISYGINPGTPEHQETHTVTANHFGLFTLKIGQGTPVFGTFPGINWALGNQYLLVEMDPTGGSNYM